MMRMRAVGPDGARKQRIYLSGDAVDSPGASDRDGGRAGGRGGGGEEAGGRGAGRLGMRRESAPSRKARPGAFCFLLYMKIIQNIYIVGRCRHRHYTCLRSTRI